MRISPTLRPQPPDGAVTYRIFLYYVSYRDFTILGTFYRNFITLSRESAYLLCYFFLLETGFDLGEGYNLPEIFPIQIPPKDYGSGKKRL